MEELDYCPLCRGRDLRTLCAQNQFAECGACGLVFDNPRPTWTEIHAFYSKHDQYDAWLRELEGRDALWRRRLRRVRRHICGGSLLDVGTGIGQFLSFAKQHFAVEGTEISPVAVSIAKERYGMQVHRGTLESLGLKGPRDAVTLFHVLEHVPDPALLLSLCFELLEPGGYCFIAIPNDIEAWGTRRNRAMRKAGASKYEALGRVGLPKVALDGSEIHLTHFRPKTLRFAVEQAGFECVEYGLDPYFSVTGTRKLRRWMRYGRYWALHKATGLNLYETQWMTARKPRAVVSSAN